MDDPAVRGAVIVAFAAVLVSVLTQAVAVYNQWYTNKEAKRRETEKYYNEVYQKLFAPVIPDAFLYIDLVTSFRRGHDSTPEREIEVKDRVVEHIRENLVYGSPRLITAYHNIQRSGISDQSGLNPTFAELRLLATVVQEFEQVIRQSSIFAEKNTGDPLSPVYESMTLYLLYNSEYRGNVYSELAKHSWMFDNVSFTRRNYQKIRGIIRERDRSREEIRRRSENERSKLERSLEGKSQDEHATAWNKAIAKTRPVEEKAYKEINDRTLKRILRVMVRYESRREYIVKLMKLEAQARTELDNGPTVVLP